MYNQLNAVIDMSLPSDRPLSDKELFNARQEWREDEPVSGVYFLFRECRIAYIGKSTNVRSRVREHMRTSKKYDSWSFIAHPVEQLGHLEAFYIHTHNPVDNGNYQNGDKVAHLPPEQALRFFNQKEHDE